MDLRAPSHSDPFIREARKGFSLFEKRASIVRYFGDTLDRVIAEAGNDIVFRDIKDEMETEFEKIWDLMAPLYLLRDGKAPKDVGARSEEDFLSDMASANERLRKLIATQGARLFEALPCTASLLDVSTCGKIVTGLVVVWAQCQDPERPRRGKNRSPDSPKDLP